MPSRPKRYRPITTATLVGLSSLILPTLSLLRLYTYNATLWPSIYSTCASLMTFLLYGYDKMQARNLEWRVRESTLHLMSLAGGWPGALVGMHYFQHKTKKVRFLVVFWGIVGVWEAISWVVWSSGFEVG